MKMVALVLAVAIGQAQQTSTKTRLVFEVTSVKPNVTVGDAVSFGVGNGRGGGRNVTPKTLIALAYRLQEFQISGAPNWANSERFDVEGISEDKNAGPAELRRMLQSLLEERLLLKFHRETRKAPVYLLTVAKGGPRIRSSEDQSPDVNGAPQPGAGPNHGAIRVGPGSLTGNAVTLALFAKTLSQRLDRAIVDRTDLTGRFDIRLEWTPDPLEQPLGPGGSPLARADLSGPSIFSAIQEQLGLKLETAKGLDEIFVIEHVEHPTKN
jgi:uncharacterized protein (TIGR03435 family)